MKNLVLIFSIFIISNAMLIYDFDKNSKLNNWNIVDDIVMGGRSAGECYINDQGNAVFQGRVSLENNGGFSSFRHRFAQEKVDAYEKVQIRLKGDGKRYQFRVKSSKYDRHSYIYYFQTTGEWETIEVPLEEMYPTFRGRKLKMPNYPGNEMEELAFLIANKKAEDFRLEIDFLKLIP